MKALGHALDRILHGLSEAYRKFRADAFVPSLVNTPRHGLVGRVLIATAVQLSQEEGFKGGVGLHALPQAETFYARQCGMTDLGKDMRKEGLRYFEMTPEQAADFLR